MLPRINDPENNAEILYIFKHLIGRGQLSRERSLASLRHVVDCGKCGENLNYSWGNILRQLIARDIITGDFCVSEEKFNKIMQHVFDNATLLRRVGAFNGSVLDVPMYKKNKITVVGDLHNSIDNLFLACKIAELNANPHNLLLSVGDIISPSKGRPGLLADKSEIELAKLAIQDLRKSGLDTRAINAYLSNNQMPTISQIDYITDEARIELTRRIIKQGRESKQRDEHIDKTLHGLGLPKITEFLKLVRWLPSRHLNNEMLRIMFALMALYPSQVFMVLGNHERSLLRLAKQWPRVNKKHDRVIEDSLSEAEVATTHTSLIEALAQLPQLIRVGDFLSVQHGNGSGCRHLARKMIDAQQYTEFDDERVEGKVCLGYGGAEHVARVCENNGAKITVTGHVGLAGLNKMRDEQTGLPSALIYDKTYNGASVGRFVNECTGQSIYVVDSDGSKPGTAVLQFLGNEPGIVQKLY